jgi:hypothetical protein
MTNLSRREFSSAWLGRVAALLGTGVVASPGVAAAAATRSAPGDVSARDLRKMSRAEVWQALRRIRAKRRAR